jgi:hypothetical protein
VAIAATLALLLATPPLIHRELAGDPTKTPGAQTVDHLQWVKEQIDFITNGMSDMQLYASGNLLLGFAIATAVTAAYTWRKTLASPWLRARRAGGVLTLNEQLQARLRAAGTTSYSQILERQRGHIRTIDRGMPFRREVLAAFDGHDVHAVEMLFARRPEVEAAIRAHPGGSDWMNKFKENRALLLDADVLEIHAKGVRFEEASKRLLEFFSKGAFPPGLPHQKEFRAINSPEKLQAWMTHPEVVRFLSSDRADVQEWQNALVDRVRAENAAFEDMQRHYLKLAREVATHLEAVDRAGSGLVYMARMIQPQVRFMLDRYPHEPYGTYYTLNNGFYSNFTSGRRVQETLVFMDDVLRKANQATRVEHGLACRQRLEALVVSGSALLLGGVGWMLRDASNRRLQRTAGRTGDEIVAAEKERARAEDSARAKDAAEPPEVARRLYEVRTKPEETELRELYAVLRKTMRDEAHLPVIAQRIRGSFLVSKDTLAAGRFEEKLQAFLDDKDNEAADAVIDAAIANATHGSASTVPAIKDLLFGDDPTRAAFREKVRGLLYPSIVKALWPTIVPDASAFPVDQALFSRMLKESQDDFDRISQRYRSRLQPSPRPTDLFPKLSMPPGGAAPPPGPAAAPAPSP